ncbi:MAG: hypothetical protein IPO90_17310 [Flavobacteriales bacterium]|nr:hypothetical protein [Flavobacteriales bacterium]
MGVRYVECGGYALGRDSWLLPFAVVLAFAERIERKRGSKGQEFDDRVVVDKAS